MYLIRSWWLWWFVKTAIIQNFIPGCRFFSGYSAKFANWPAWHCFDTEWSHCKNLQSRLQSNEGWISIQSFVALFFISPAIFCHFPQKLNRHEANTYITDEELAILWLIFPTNTTFKSISFLKHLVWKRLETKLLDGLLFFNKHSKTEIGQRQMTLHSEVRLLYAHCTCIHVCGSLLVSYCSMWSIQNICF